MSVPISLWAKKTDSFILGILTIMTVDHNGLIQLYNIS